MAAAMEKVGAMFLGELAPDLCREDVTMEEISKRILAIRQTISEHYSTFERMRTEVHA